MERLVINNWALIHNECDKYTSPELIERYVIGDVDGKMIRTSNIVSIDKNTITTQNSIYELGEPASNYVKWCKDNNQHIPTKECPIKEIR
jgi:hypothetical protein